MKSIEIMKKIDDLLFQNMEKLRLYDQFVDFTETYSNWEEKSQEMFKAGLLAVIVFIPTIIIFIFFMMNSSAHSNLETKEEILKIASKISSQKTVIIKLNSKYLSSPITSQSMLETQIKNGLPGMNIDTSKITVSNFESTENDGLNKASADIRFKELSSQNLFGFLRIITISKKMRIEEVDIKKNKQTNLLEGLITVFHYSKLSSADNE